MAKLLYRCLAVLAAAALMPAAAQDKSAAVHVVLATSEGEIRLQLDAAKAPKTVANFVEYVKSGQYDGTIFHRVIDSFMIQGGGFTAEMKEKKTRAPVENEANNGLRNDKYTVAMARTPDPHSASAQFFINVADNQFLNHSAPTAQGWGYCVFGRVVEGMDVVDRIKAVATTSVGPHQNVPTKSVLIRTARVVK